MTGLLALAAVALRAWVSLSTAALFSVAAVVAVVAAMPTALLDFAAANMLAFAAAVAVASVAPPPIAAGTLCACRWAAARAVWALFALFTLDRAVGA